MPTSGSSTVKAFIGTSLWKTLSPTQQNIISGLSPKTVISLVSEGYYVYTSSATGAAQTPLLHPWNVTKAKDITVIKIKKPEQVYTPVDVLNEQSNTGDLNFSY